jgi:hypothetical protein
MNAPRTVVDLRSTGSPSGMTVTLEGATCERRAWYAAQEVKPEVPRLYAESEGKPEKLLVGSGVHGVLAEWYAGKSVVNPIFTWYGEDIELSHPASCAEIRRLWEWYSSTHKPTEFGKVLAIEVGFAFPPDGDFLPGFTGNLDLIVECSAADVERLMLLYGLELPGPGVYAVDHKTAAQASEKAQQEYDLRPQFPGYIVGAEELNFPLKGLIVNRIMKTKVRKDGTGGPKRELYFVAPPDAHGVNMLTSLVKRRNAMLRIQDESLVQTNPDSCMGKFGDICKFLNKPCRRY